jgi:hypothetical protein
MIIFARNIDEFNDKIVDKQQSIINNQSINDSKTPNLQNHMDTNIKQSKKNNSTSKPPSNDENDVKLINKIYKYIQQYSNKTQKITLDLKVDKNTLGIEDSIKQYQTKFNNQTIHYQDNLDKTLLLQSISSNLGILTDFPMTNTIINSPNFILNNHIREQLQEHILKTDKNKNTYLTNDLLQLLYSISQQVQNIDDNTLSKVIFHMYSNLFTSKDVYDFENKLAHIVTEYSLEIPSIVFEMDDLYYVVLQSSFKNGVADEPFGVTNTNEKNSIMRPYSKSTSIPFSLNSIMKILEHENSQGAHKNITINPIQDNVFKVILTPDDNKDSLQGIVLLFNGEEINQNTLIYSQILDLFKSTMKDTIISQLLKMASGSSQNFQTNEEKLNQDKNAIVNELKLFMQIDNQIRSNIINQDGKIIIAFNIEGNIHNQPLTGVRINNTKIDNLAKSKIESKILNVTKDVFAKNATIYDINLKDKNKIEHTIESTLREYGLSYGEYYVLNNELVIEITNEVKERESLDIKCNSQILNSEQIIKLNEACMKTSDPMGTAEEMIKSFGTISGKLIDPITNNQVIMFSPKTMDLQSNINTKEELFDFNPPNIVICLLSHLALIPNDNFLSSLKTGIVRFEVKLKDLFGAIVAGSKGEWGEIISITPGVKLVSLMLNNGSLITTSLNSNIPVIDIISKLFKRENIKLIEVINPSIENTIKAGIYKLNTKYKFKDEVLSNDIICSNDIDIGNWQLHYNMTLGADISIDQGSNDDKVNNTIILDINRKASMIIALSNPDYIWHSTFKTYDKYNQPEIPFLKDLDQSNSYTSLSYVYPSTEIFDSKRLLGEQMIKIILVYGFSVMSSSVNKFGIGFGFGLGIILNGQLSYIIQISAQHVLGKDGKEQLTWSINVYSGDGIGLYNNQGINYNNTEVYNRQLSFLN